SFFFYSTCHPRDLHSFPTRRSSDLLPINPNIRNECKYDKTIAIKSGISLALVSRNSAVIAECNRRRAASKDTLSDASFEVWSIRSEEHTSELQSRGHLVCRLLLEKK